MKWAWIFLIALIVLGLGAYGYHKLAQKMQAPQMVQQSTPGIGSIQQALSGNVSLQCQFTADDGSSVIAYIKMGAVHVDTNTGKATAASFIMKDKKMYFWQVGSTTGTMMSVPEITPTGTQNQGQTMMMQLEKFKDSCKVATVADTLFTPPANVKFTDMSSMMPSGVPSIPQYKAPSGYGY